MINNRVILTLYYTTLLHHKRKISVFLRSFFFLRILYMAKYIKMSKKALKLVNEIKQNGKNYR